MLCYPVWLMYKKIRKESLKLFAWSVDSYLVFFWEIYINDRPLLIIITNSNPMRDLSNWPHLKAPEMNQPRPNIWSTKWVWFNINKTKSRLLLFCSVLACAIIITFERIKAASRLSRTTWIESISHHFTKNKKYSTSRKLIIFFLETIPCHFRLLSLATAKLYGGFNCPLELIIS